MVASPLFDLINLYPVSEVCLLLYFDLFFSSSTGRNLHLMQIYARLFSGKKTDVPEALQVRAAGSYLFIFIFVS